MAAPTHPCHDKKEYLRLNPRFGKQTLYRHIMFVGCFSPLSIAMVISKLVMVIESMI